ncbi:MAG: Na/Pi cotransporter family protein [Gammaproteobacteria bacterium]|nr:MAG: Na/Pi cotransporter family protein [Gammaproteobacteria bacterium]
MQLDMPNFEPWELVAGLGLFLFGMTMLEQALRTLGTRSFRHLLRDYTKTPVRGVFIGIISTACLQSSSMVGLIVLAFVGAGILTMTNALGVIFGANLGTTFTGWIVATIGFRMSLTEYAMPMLALGTLGVVFLNPDYRRHSQARLLLGLGLLLMGLDFMKTSMGFLSEHISPSVFSEYPILLYVVGGLIFTALIQSSSATMMIVLSAIHAGVLPLTTAAAIVIGANLGTTSTVIIGGIKGSSDKRRVALSHFIFNLVVSAVALLLMYPLLDFITGTLTVTDPMYVLVLFHSLFNGLGILIFLPIVSPFAKWLQGRFTEDDLIGCQYITKVSPTVSDAATEAIRQEVIRLYYKVMILNLRVLRIRPEELLPGFKGLEVYEQIKQAKSSYDDQYSEIKHTEQQILQYANRILREKSGEGVTEKVSQLVHASRDLVYGAKSLKNVRQNIVELRTQSDDEELIETLRHDTRNIYRHLLNLVEHTDPVLLEEKHLQLQEEINLSHDRLHQLMTRYDNSVAIGIPLSSLLNINRELLVSNQMLSSAVRDLVMIKP